MAVDSDVKVIIDLQRPTPKTGLGKPMIIGPAAAGTDYKVYYGLDAVLKDFPNSSEVYKAAYAIFNQGNDSPESIAVMQYATDKLVDFLPSIFSKDWYYLVSVSNVVDDVVAIGDAVELDNTRQFFTRISKKADLETIFAKKYKRTTIMYHSNATNYPEAAWIGRAGTAEAGSLTWKFKTLTGITPMDIDQTELMEVHNLGANTYVTKAGDDITSEGKTVGGEYIDIVQSEDYLVLNIELAIQKLFNRAPKVRYDNTGIAQMEGEVRTVLRRADLNGMIAHDDDGLPLFSTTFKPRSQVDPADREKREYNDGSFEFELAGAIHKATIRGLIKL